MTTTERKLDSSLSTRLYRGWSSGDLLSHYLKVRKTTERLCETMQNEDYVVQTMPDVSPTKWHLAHTAWFFEAFVLFKYVPNYKSLNKLYAYLFNSYYNAIGEQFCRPRRGQISRPNVEQIYEYRAYVDQHMVQFIEALDSNHNREELLDLVVLGLNHEQQHQELLVCDIKNVLFMNPLYPALYDKKPPETNGGGVSKLEWIESKGGLLEFGYSGQGFHFDSESPLHKRYLEPFRVANRLVTNGEFLEFIEDSGYSRPDLWLSLAWSLVQERATRELEHERFDKPLYWVKEGDKWFLFTLYGLVPLPLDEPVSHVSYFEADAYARWADKRLPTEFEWEDTAKNIDPEKYDGNFQDNWRFQPSPSGVSSGGAPLQIYGDLWEWTSSAFEQYPGFKPAEGAVGEYNGKFMANQLVLRGGSCATPRDHIRSTYRNFFYAPDKWQFMGFRLAQNLA